jgi:hypothetical protein
MKKTQQVQGFHCLKVPENQIPYSISFFPLTLSKGEGGGTGI